jgi:serine/threonine protein phosphatase PrpC
VDVTDATKMTCAACEAPLQPGDRFCEQCGARQVEDQESEGACQACGAAASQIEDDGYCSVCGARARTTSDRVELDLNIAAAVSDRGLVHRRNEDAFGLEVRDPDGLAAVICDGISSASAGDAAARDAAGAATDELARALDDRGLDASQATLDAVLAAQRAVAGVAWTTRTDRGWPSCTLVCALSRDGQIVIGSVGDSRAYWIDADGARQLTIDDSWAEEQAEEGVMTFEQALEDPRSHAITHWIGADAPDRAPRLATLRPPGPGRLLLCSDGLWNYVSRPEELGDLINALPEGASAAAVASALTDTAVGRGGRDNITVAVLDIQLDVRSHG